MDKITLVQTIEIDLASERKRINRKGLYKKKEQILLLKMIDLFEVGNIQGMIELQEEWNKIDDYPIFEYLTEQLYQIVSDLVKGKTWNIKK